MKRNSKGQGMDPRRKVCAPSAPRRNRPAQEFNSPHDEAHDEHAERAESDHGPDDALGLYLRQMGMIPLLKRDEELAMARRLEKARDRYRRAAFLCPSIIRRIQQTFARVVQGQIQIDPTIDVVASLNLTRECIQKRMPAHLRSLGQLLKKHEEAFADYLKARSTDERHELRCKRWKILRKATKLISELSPRTELVERWHQDMLGPVEELSTLARRLAASGLRGERATGSKRLRDAMGKRQATTTELKLLARALAEQRRT